MIYSILVVVQVVVALTLIGIILVQHGKGADAGAAFGSGASGTVFGAKGSANFLTHATATLAVVFFVISMALAYLVNGASAPTGSVTDQVQQQPPGSSLITGKQNGAPAGSAKLGANQENASAGSGGPAPTQKAAGGANPGAKNGGRGGGNNSGGADTGPKIPE